MYDHMLKKTIPESCRKFDSKKEERYYLFTKISYWLHVRKKRRNCCRYMDRFLNIISCTRLPKISILKHSMLATIAEYENRWKDAIKYRKMEVSLIIRLYNSFTPEQTDDLRNYILQDSKPNQVIRYLRIIKSTYKKAGEYEGVKILTNLQSEIKKYQGRF